VTGSGAKPPEAESSVALEAPAEELNLALVTDSFSACHSITIASGALMLRICRLDHLCVCVCVCVSGKCTMAKRLIGSGCHLG